MAVPGAVPPDREVEALVRSVADAGVRLVGLNFFAGDLAAGDRGLMSWPGRPAELRDNLEATVGIGERLGCRAFNALYGNRVEGADPDAQDELAVEQLAMAGRAAARVGGTVLVEPVSGAPRYPLRTAADAVAVIDRVAAETGVTNLGLLCDLYHLASNGDDLDRAIATYGDRVAHVQLATSPGGTSPAPAPSTSGATWAAGRRGYAAGSASSTSPAGPAPTASAGSTPKEQPPDHHRRLRRPRHHGRPDGRQPGQAASTSSATTAPRAGPAAGGGGRAGPAAWPRPSPTPTW